MIVCTHSMFAWAWRSELGSSMTPPPVWTREFADCVEEFSTDLISTGNTDKNVLIGRELLGCIALA